MMIKNYNEKMIYRRLGKTNLMVSAMSLGGNRIKDENLFIETVHRAMELGVNLIETGIGYKNSEKIIGKALKNNRNNIYISTKQSVEDDYGNVITSDVVKRNIESSLSDLQTDYVDIYNIWNIKSGKQMNEAVKKGGFISVIYDYMSQGVIKHLGFSSHDSPSAIKKYIKSGYFKSAILSYNILDKSNREVIEYAYDTDIGVLVMRPFHGGLLCSDIDIGNSSYRKERLFNNVETSIFYLLKHPHITSIIIGMHSPKEVEDNINILYNLDSVQSDFIKITDKLIDKHDMNKFGFCSSCGYCNCCPNKIPISKLMKAYNFLAAEDISESDIKSIMKTYSIDFSQYRECSECGLCERLCTNNIDIINRIKDLKRR